MEKKETRRERRIFTLSEARKTLPLVKQTTDRYSGEIEELQRLFHSGEAAGREKLEHEVEKRIRAWSREILELGAEPKGLWLVDFDSGDGFYFCWQRGEEDIEHIHGYDAGFAGRRKIDWKRGERSE